MPASTAPPVLSALPALNEWSSNMKSLLGLLERVDHLITKEEMMARIQPGAAGGKGGKEKKGKKKAAA